MFRSLEQVCNSSCPSASCLKTEFGWGSAFVWTYLFGQTSYSQSESSNKIKQEFSCFTWSFQLQSNNLIKYFILFLYSMLHNLLIWKDKTKLTFDERGAKITFDRITCLIWALITPCSDLCHIPLTQITKCFCWV